MKPPKWFNAALCKFTKHRESRIEGTTVTFGGEPEPYNRRCNRCGRTRMAAKRVRKGAA